MTAQRQVDESGLQTHGKEARALPWWRSSFVVGGLGLLGLSLLALSFLLAPQTSTQTSRDRLPAAALVRHFEAKLERQAAVSALPAWAQSLLGIYGYKALTPSDIATALSAYETFLGERAGPDAMSDHARSKIQARLLVLKAEHDRIGGRKSELIDLGRNVPEAAAYVGQLYDEPALVALTAAAWTVEDFSLSPEQTLATRWVEDQLLLQDARARGPSVLQTTERAIARDRSRKLARLYPAIGLSLGLLIVCSIIAILSLRQLAGRMRVRSSQELGFSVQLPLLVLALSLFASSSVVATGCCLLIVMKYRRSVGLTWRHLRLSAMLLVAATGYVLLQATSWALSYLALILPQTFHWGDGFVKTLVWGEPHEVLALGLFIALIGPLIEEFVYRGTLLPLAKQYVGRVGAILLTSFIFAAFHNYSLIGFVFVFVLGAICAVAYERTGSLWPAFMIHAANNTLWLMFYLAA